MIKCAQNDTAICAPPANYLCVCVEHSRRFKKFPSPGDAGDGVDSPNPRSSVSFTSETVTVQAVEVTVQVNSVTAINIKRILFDVDFTLMCLGEVDDFDVFCLFFLDDVFLWGRCTRVKNTWFHFQVD